MGEGALRAHQGKLLSLLIGVGLSLSPLALSAAPREAASTTPQGENAETGSSTARFAPSEIHFNADPLQAQLRIDLPEGAEALLFEQDPRSPVVLLRGLNLAPEDEQRFDVSAYESFVTAIELFRGVDGTPQLLFSLSDAAEVELLRQGRQFSLQLRRLVAPQREETSTAQARASERMPLSSASTVTRGAPYTSAPQRSAAGSVAYALSQPIGDALPPGYRPLAPRRRQKRYNGQRISINIQNSPIQNVLRFIAQWGGINIVTSDDVEGNVTLMLNQVPWDQALEIVLRSKGLDMVRQGNIIRVAPREAIAAERPGRPA